MSKCSVCGGRFVKGDPDFYYCPGCQKKYHKGCFERFGCTDSSCSEYRGCGPAGEDAAPPVPGSSAGEGAGDRLQALIRYHDAVVTCPDCGKKVPLFIWNYRLGCPAPSCMERKEHLYWRTGAGALLAALAFGILRAGKLFAGHAAAYAVLFVLLFVLLAHLGMYVKIRYMYSAQIPKFLAGLAQGAAAAAVLVLFCVLYTQGILGAEYKKGMRAMEAGNYAEAKRLFESAGDFRDSRVLAAKADIKECDRIYRQAEEALRSEDYTRAIELLGSIRDYRDSRELLKEAKYRQAKISIASGDIKTAVNLFTDLGDYKDSGSILKTIAEKALPALGSAIGSMWRKDSGEEEDGSTGLWGRLLGGR